MNCSRIRHAILCVPLFFLLFLPYQSVAISESIDQKLLRSAKTGDLNQIKTLLNQGANLNYSDYHGDSPLIMAVAFNHFELTQYLISHGVDINHQDNYGRTALFIASVAGYMNILKSLHRQGANIHISSKVGTTPLMEAAYKGHLNIIHYLLENGADINHKDNHGSTALIYATRNSHKHIVKRLLQQRFLFFLPATNVNSVNRRGKTALDYAKNKDIYQILLKFDAKKGM